MAKHKKSFIERIKPTGIKDLIRRIILLVCICVFCYSAYNLASIFLEYKQMDDSNKEIENTYVTEQTEERGSYKKIDFDALVKRNPDVKGWIDIPDTRVSYPILQGETNDTYIHSDIDKKEFRAGSIFIASENENPFTDLNTVIYGHNMNNGSMFNNIKSYTKQDFANEHPYVYIYLPDGTVSRYKVVSAHIIPELSILYNTSITDIQSFYQEMLKTSDINVDFDKVANKPVITLSTCTSAGSESGKRNVVHAVLDKAGIDPEVEKMDE
ncbi:class B sortase [Thomasclavelia cocleata]|uniref:class B sortase n=1 Tax=Thomasclavelia cocleata TaxID=69824 RepID=UPI00242AA052|nr:class B sortase [Thomasclavelia cocleata]MCI9132467.1 class B sortase [Thomasclavelia cocleata]